MTEVFGEEFVCHTDCHLNPKSTALLIVDMQYHDAHPDFGFNLAVARLNPGSMDYFNKRNEAITVPTIKALLDLFRKHGMNVVYLMLGSDYPDYRDWNQRLRLWVLDLEKKSGMSGIFWSQSESYRIRDELRPLPSDIIVRKKSFGAFNSSNLEEELKGRGIDTLVITGVSTNSCVETTARDAADRGFNCTIIDHGTCDYTEEFHRASLEAFKFNFGEVLLDENEVRAALFRDEVPKAIPNS